MNTAIKTPRKRIYGVVLWILIISVVAYLLSFLATALMNNTLSKREQQLQQVEQKIKEVWSEKAVLSYKFAEEQAQQKTITWSDQITALIDILRKIQEQWTIGNNAIQLSDFSISPTELALHWKVSNLILLYYSSSTNGYIDLISRFTELSFVTNIEIKTYQKVWDYYEFTLYADINPNAVHSDT